MTLDLVRTTISMQNKDEIMILSGDLIMASPPKSIVVHVTR